MRTKPEQKYKIVILVHFFSAATIILFWIGYYLSPVVSWSLPAFYSGYGNALPFPDGLLALITITAGILMLRQRRLGQYLTVLAAVVFILLGVVGFNLNLSDGKVLISMVSMLKSGFVNLWCVVFGLYFLLNPRDRQDKQGS